MKLIRTAKIKIDAKPPDILPTLIAYTNAFNLVCQVGFHDKDFNGVSLHNKTYKECRETLPSQLAISARMKATEALKPSLKGKKETKCPQSKLTSVRLDARSYNVWFEKNIVSILLVGERRKFNFRIPESYKEYIEWKRTSADLCVKGKDVYLNIVFEKDIEDKPQNDTYVGVDRGIRKLAVTSSKEFYQGGEVRRVVRKYQKLRSSLQSCGSRSAKRHLRRLSGKENRFRKDVNHKLSRNIINGLSEGSTIVLENLKGIRQRAKFRKEQRNEFHSWGFYQLEEFLIYKGMEKSIRVVRVDARYTSQKCSKCSHTEKSNRSNQSQFSCKECGYQLNADLNASINIRQNYLDSITYPDRATVKKPIV